MLHCYYEYKKAGHVAVKYKKSYVSHRHLSFDDSVFPVCDGSGAFGNMAGDRPRPMHPGRLCFLVAVPHEAAYRNANEEVVRRIALKLLLKGRFSRIRSDSPLEQSRWNLRTLCYCDTDIQTITHNN